jgi:hypothetical protein
MALIDMLTDITSFDYSKVGVKQGEYFGEDKATGFTPNRQTKNPTEFVANQITGLGITDYFTPNYNPLEEQNETSIHLTNTVPPFPGPVDYFKPDFNPFEGHIYPISGNTNLNYFTPDYNPLEDQDETSIHLTNSGVTFPGPVDYFKPDFNPFEGHIYPISGNTNLNYFTPDYNPLIDSSIFESSFVNYFDDTNQTGFITPIHKESNFILTGLIGATQTYVDYFDNTHQTGFSTPVFQVSNFVNQDGFTPTAVNYFGDENHPGFNLNISHGADVVSHYIEGSGNDWNFSEGSFTDMFDINAKFTSGNFVPTMVDTDFDTDNFGSNLISIDYSRLQKARQGKATNKPNQGDFGESHEYGVDGEEGRYHTELRLRAKTPGFLARLLGAQDDVTALYEFKGGMAKALREPNNFGFDEPFIVHDIGDGYDSIGLDDGIFRGGAALNVVRAAEDAIRFTKWTLTPRGIIWNLKQFVLQAQNPISANRIFNPLGVIGSILPMVHLPRHTDGTFFDFNEPPSYDTDPKGKNITIPKEEEEGGLGGLLGGLAGALGISAPRTTNRLVDLHKSRIVEGEVGSPTAGLLGALGLGNNAFEDPIHSVKSTKGPFGEKSLDEIEKSPQQGPTIGLGPSGETIKQNSKGKWYYIQKHTGLAVITEEPTNSIVGNANVNLGGKVSEAEDAKEYNLGSGKIKTENGMYSVGVSNQLQVPYGGQFDKLNDSIAHLPKDFIKFRIRDAVNGKWLIFPAHMGTITDTVTPTWTPEKYIGRPDSIHLYGGTDRSVSFDFKVAAFTKQEIPIIQEKMNYLMGLGYPTYKKIMDTDDEERPVAPYIYLTIGDLFNNTPGYFSSIAITIEENATWEIDDKFQIPQVFSVSVEFVHVGKYLPQTLGKHYEVPWLKDIGVGKNKYGTFGSTNPRDGTVSRPTVDDSTNKWSKGVVPHEAL